jgi:hypothetical protein
MRGLDSHATACEHGLLECDCINFGDKTLPKRSKKAMPANPIVCRVSRLIWQHGSQFIQVWVTDTASGAMSGPYFAATNCAPILGAAFTSTKIATITYSKSPGSDGSPFDEIVLVDLSAT